MCLAYLQYKINHNISFLIKVIEQRPFLVMVTLTPAAPTYNMTFTLGCYTYVANLFKSVKPSKKPWKQTDQLTDPQA